MLGNEESPGSTTRFSFGSISTASVSSSDNQQNTPLTPNDNEEEVESEALEDTLGDLAVKVFHRLLWPGSTLILSSAPATDHINEALSVSVTRIHINYVFI